MQKNNSFTTTPTLSSLSSVKLYIAIQQWSMMDYSVVYNIGYRCINAMQLLLQYHWLCVVNARPRQQWSLLKRFRNGQGHCGACKKKWKLSDSDQCSCGETQTMSRIVESCPQTRLHSGLSKLHSADDDAFTWLTSYGS